MNRLVLANADYKNHMTDEGEQLQAGLAAAGWHLAGHGYDDGCVDVPTLLERHNPDVVFVQDPRDWDRNHPGCFEPATSFTGIAVLGQRPDIFKVMPVKDAGSSIGYQRAVAQEIKPDAIVLYYAEAACTTRAPWLADHHLIRTYHSVDADFIGTLDLRGSRVMAPLVSGALSGVYPLRQRVAQQAGYLGIDVEPHPGYGNSGCFTQEYLRLLSRRRVHIATASAYGFALRKIIESVACGCVCITDLPATDKLPEIDDALTRIPNDATIEQVKDAIDLALSKWNIAYAVEWSARARDFYSWPAVGRRLDAAIAKAQEDACPSPSRSPATLSTEKTSAPSVTPANSTKRSRSGRTAAGSPKRS